MPKWLKAILKALASTAIIFLLWAGGGCLAVVLFSPKAAMAIIITAAAGMFLGIHISLTLFMGRRQ
jgi:hypothetical protein